MLTLFKRIVKIGYKNFFRSMGLNIATVFIISMAVCLISTLYIFNVGSRILISSIQEKVDVSIYFREEAPTEEILSVKSALSEIPEVKSVDYISKEESLENFVERHKDDLYIMESLMEIGINPFLSSLTVRAQDGLHYEKIAGFLESDSYNQIIEKIDYYQRKPVIDKVFSITSGVNKGGIVLSIILGIIAILVAFNTVRIAICNSQEEISVMRLVGARNLFIRGPFFIQGILWGISSALVSLVFITIICYGLNSPLSNLAGVSIFSLFAANFWALVLIQFAGGMVIGAVSSLAAIEKYLRV